MHHLSLAVVTYQISVLYMVQNYRDKRFSSCFRVLYACWKVLLFSYYLYIWVVGCFYWAYRRLVRKFECFSYFCPRLSDQGKSRNALRTVKLGFWIFVIRVCEMVSFWHIFYIHSFKGQDFLKLCAETLFVICLKE